MCEVYGANWKVQYQNQREREIKLAAEKQIELVEKRKAEHATLDSATTVDCGATDKKVRTMKNGFSAQRNQFLPASLYRQQAPQSQQQSPTSIESEVTKSPKKRTSVETDASPAVRANRDSRGLNDPQKRIKSSNSPQKLPYSSSNSHHPSTHRHRAYSNDSSRSTSRNRSRSRSRDRFSRYRN